GHGAPISSHPNLIKKDGIARVNHMQRLPYPSNTILLNPNQYSVITNILQDVCAIVAEAIEKYLPDEYSHLDLACSLMPLDENVFSAPFTGFVLNLSCTTLAHKDRTDGTLCVVLPFGQFTGGEIVEYETGLVINLMAGDFFAFPSARITHFNLPYSGCRGSLVFHSDLHSASWVKDRNGWSEHIHTTFTS
ncbi:hypothetical protein BDR05DRAFT_894621, partial [Suillus weaverae]